MTGRRDSKAPKHVEVQLTAAHGKSRKPWAKCLVAPPKNFSTGSVGYFLSTKIMNPESGELYTVQLTMTLVGSKPIQGPGLFGPKQAGKKGPVPIRARKTAKKKVTKNGK